MSWSALASGDAVEVLYDDGVALTWRPARLIHPFLTRRLYFVAFDGGASRATVAAKRVRPRPIPAAASGSGFELHQLVDAKTDGVWRPGVVSKVHVAAGREGRYGVCFPHAREEMEFRSEEVRARLDWVDGKWVSAEEKDVDHVMFGEGTRVEVSRDREHYGAAWFAGTVLKVIGKTYFLVEYNNLRVNSDNRTETLLKEIVDMQYIRPCPPSLVSNSFNVLDEVEGFHQDGWFVGIVSMILPGSRYIVKYKHQEEKVVLDNISLRPCQVWTDGHWVCSSQKIVAMDKEKTKDRNMKGERRGRGRPTKQSTEFSAGETEIKITEDEKKERQGLNEHARPMKQSIDSSAGRESKTKMTEDNEKESEGLNEHGRPMERSSEFSPAKENGIKITVWKEIENQCSNGRGRGRPKKQRTDPFAEKKSETAKEKESQGLDKARRGRGKHKKQTLSDSSPTTPKEETVVSQEKQISSGKQIPDLDKSKRGRVRRKEQTTDSKNGFFTSTKTIVSKDQHHKRQTPRETNSAVPRWSSGASKRTRHPLSQLMTSDDVVDVAWGSTLSNLKRRIADGPSQGLDESSLAVRKSKKENLSEDSEQHMQLLNDTSLDKRESLSIPVPNFRNNGGEIADSSEAMDLNGQYTVSLSLEGGVELSQPCKKLKKGNVLGEHLQLDDETQSIIRKPRSNACKQTSLPILVLTSSNDDGEVAAISGVLNSKDNLYHSSKKSEKRNSLEEHLQSDCTLKECPSRLGEGTECQSKEVNFVRSPVANRDADFVPTAYCRNGKGNPSPTVNTRMLRKELVVWTPKRPVKTPNVVDIKHPVLEEIKQYKRAIPPKKKITFMTSMESKQLRENDRVFENTNSLPNISTEENSPGDGYTSLFDKQVDLMEDAHAVPRIESSILNTESLEYEVVHQLQALKSFLGSWCCTNRLAEARAEAQHQAIPSISSGLPSDNVVEIKKARTNSTPTASSPSEDINVCDENEYSQSRVLAVNAFVDAEDRAPLDPSPSGSSLPREDVVADHNEVTPCLSLSCRPVFEMEQVPCYPTPCWSSPSNKQEKPVESVMSSVISCSLINKCGEIQSCVNELGENRRKRKNQALPAVFEKDVALKGDKLASIGSVILKDGEMALLGPSPMELPSENSVLPFTKRSEFWDSVERKEVFRLLPQQPHFRPLLQYGKEFRDGMAIGLMVTFAHVVTDLNSLHIADSHQEFEEKLKALGPLEANGFNIQPVRDRLEKLLELHSTLTQSEGKKQLLGVKAAELEDEKHQNDMLKFLVEKCMSVLEQNLTRLRERRASVLLDIRKNDSELANLLRHVQAAEEASVSAERQFSTTLTAPW